jgi:hypothetical protein
VEGNNYLVPQSKATTFYDALLECRFASAQDTFSLASVVTAREQNFLCQTMGLCNDSAMSWLGGIKLPGQDSWLWDDGEPFIYQNFAPGQELRTERFPLCTVLTGPR